MDGPLFLIVVYPALCSFALWVWLERHLMVGTQAAARRRDKIKGRQARDDTIAQRVELITAQYTPSSTYLAKEYLESIVANLRETDKAFHGLIHRMVLFAAAFVFLTIANIRQFSLLGMTIDVTTVPIGDIAIATILKLAVLVLVSYYYLEMELIGTMRILLVEVHRQIVKRCFPAIFNRALHNYEIPPSRFSAFTLLESGPAHPLFGLLDRGTTFYVVSLRLGSVVFIIWGFVSLFITEPSGLGRGLIVGVALVTLLLFVLPAAASTSMYLGLVEDEKEQPSAPSA